MNQPPSDPRKAQAPKEITLKRDFPVQPTPPQWRRPSGVSPGTWDYVHQRSIADHYDDFVADTPLCQVDQQIIRQTFPDLTKNPSSEPATILDLGCGTGRHSIPLAQSGYQVIGIDLSRAMLNVAHGKASQLGVAGQILPLHANLVELECFADDVADHAICMFSTIGMIAGRKNRRQLLQHVRRIVRPGGRFVLHVHNRWAALSEVGGLGRLAKSWWRSVRETDHDFGDAVYAYRGLDEMFMHRFSRRELIADLTSSDWKTKSCHSISLDGSQMTASKLRAGGFIVVCH